MTKRPKIFLADNGIRNVVAHHLDPLDIRADITWAGPEIMTDLASIGL